MSFDHLDATNTVATARARVVLIASNATTGGTTRALLHVVDRFAGIAERVRDFSHSMREFARLTAPVRPPLPALPPYRVPFYPGIYRVRILAPLARSRLKRWRSLKEKRQAWGFA